MRSFKLKNNLTAGCVFLLLTLLFFSRNILFGKTYTPLSLLSPWSGSENEEYGLTYQKDALLIHLSHDWTYNIWLKKGKILKWSPYVFSGYPLYANGHSAFHNPFKMLLNFLFSPLRAREILLFLHLFLCGFIFYATLREFGVSFLPAIFGGIVWAFSGHIISLIEWEWSVMAGAYLPLLTWGFKRWEKRHRKIDLLFSIFSVYLLYTCGNMQWTAYALVFFSGFFLYEGFRAFRKEREKGIKILSSGMAVLLTGTLLSSLELLPTLELFKLSSHTRPEASVSTLKTNYEIQIRLFFSLFHPQIMGSPFNQINLWPPNIKSFYFFNPYIGTLSLLFLITGMTLSWKREYTKFLTLTFFITLLIALGTPLTKLFTYLPIMKRFYHERILFLTVFSASIISSFGMEETLKKEGTRKKFIPLGIFVLLYLLFLFSAFKLLSPYTHPSWFSLKNPVMAKIVLLFVGSFIIFLSFITYKNKKIIAWLSLLWVAVDLLPTGMLANTCDKKEGLEIIKKIKSALPPETEQYRIAGLEPNLSALLNLYSPEGYDSLYPDILFKIFFPSPPPWLNRWILYVDSKHLPLLKLLGVKFIFKNGRLKPEDSFDALIKSGELSFYKKVGELEIYTLQDTFPRTFIPSKYTVIPSLESFIRRIYSDDNLLSPEVAILPYPLPVKEGGAGKAKIVKYEPDEVIIEVMMEKEGLVVLTDLFYPGWKAYIDGRTTKIFPVYYFLRGVIVEKGTHSLKFVFQPLSYRIGKLITLFTFVLIGIWMVL